MQLKEFKETFEGKDIEDPRHKNHVLKSIQISALGICGIDGSEWFCVRNFEDYPMESFIIYDPPKPELDFNGPGFWGSVTSNLRYYDKIGICSYLAHCGSGHVYLCSMKTILEEAVPCNPPVNRKGWEHILDALEEK